MGGECGKLYGLGNPGEWFSVWRPLWRGWSYAEVVPPCFEQGACKYALRPHPEALPHCDADLLMQRCPAVPEGWRWIAGPIGVPWVGPIGPRLLVGRPDARGRSQDLAWLWRTVRDLSELVDDLAFELDRLRRVAAIVAVQGVTMPGIRHRLAQVRDQIDVALQAVSEGSVPAR